MKRLFILPYKKGSEGAKSLTTKLSENLQKQIKQIRLENSKFKGNGKLVLNWGNSEHVPPEVLKATIINHPDNVGIASNKLKCFKVLSDAEVSVPDWTADPSVAKGWKAEVCCRTKLTGNSGEGLFIVEPDEDLVLSPLYTKYVKKKYEYRIHVMNGKVIDTQRKARDKAVEMENVDWRIRNHSNGFIFARNEDHDIPEDVTVQAVTAVNALGLDFGAVDVIWNEHYEKAYVLEVNTAPGLVGTTLENYANAIVEEFM